MTGEIGQTGRTWKTLLDGCDRRNMHWDMTH